MAARIAFLSIARTTFDIPLATEVSNSAREKLSAAGFKVEGHPGLLTDLELAKAAAHEIAQNPPDLLIALQATFADSTMMVALAEKINAPMLMWAIPEARTGGRLRLNSLCGINLAAHALTLRKKKYHYLYTQPDDPEAIKHIAALANAGNVAQQLKRTTIGVVGEHPDGFDSCHLDAPLLKEKLGVQVKRLALDYVFTRARKTQPQGVAASRAQLAQHLDNLDQLEQKPLEGTLAVYQALQAISKEQKLNGFAVRCWPEFFTDLGCAACGAMSMLNNENIPCGCEADVNGTITQLIMQWIGCEPAFGSDIVDIDAASNTGVLWHCGQAPFSMAEPSAQKHGGIHSNRRVPLVMEFPLKAGVVTLARLSRASGELRLVIGRGEVISAPPSFSGTSGVVRFENPAKQVLDTIMREGLEHHVALAYGDHRATLRALADMLNLPVLNL